MKKLFSVLLAAALFFAFTGCGASGASNTAADYSDSTQTGEVTAMDGTKVTVQLGKLAENTAPGNAAGGAAPAQNKNDSGPAGSQSETAAPVEGANAVAGGAAAQAQSGTDGAVPQTPGDTPPDGVAPGDSITFTAGETSATFDLANATIISEVDSTASAVADIAVGDVLVLTIGQNNAVTTVTIKNLNGTAATANGGFGGSGKVTQGTAATTISEDGSYTGGDYSSTGNDENALRVDGATVTLDDVTVDKSDGSSSNTEDGDFYGQNAALLAANGANVTLSNATITSSVTNGNGVFSYGAGTAVTVSNSTINTTGSNSGGIQTTGGGTTYANNLTVSTGGNSAAAIRSDRGGGTVVVNGGSYTTAGTGSPAIYSTAEVTVKNATLTATNSEAVVVEGKNSVTLENSELTGNMTGTYQGDGSENLHNIMLYQSMSGDAGEGTASFQMTGGSITANSGDLFYVTNTDAVISLSGVDLTLANNNLLTVAGNSSSRGWGTAGANGAQVAFTAADMALEGDVTVDTISALQFKLANGAVFNGSLNIVENEAGGTPVSDNAVVTVGTGATWNLTGNCTVTTLKNNGTINFNGYAITLADGTVVSK